MEKVDKGSVSATRSDPAFYQQGRKAVTDFAAKTVKRGAVALAGLATGFLALDNVTEGTGPPRGKLNTAYEAAGYSAQTAATAYREFYKILGDTDTATEASQLLAKLTRSERDVTRWTRIAAGVSGTFGDSSPIEGLIEATNETAKTAKVTGVLADALNWVGISEDDFNKRLERCSEEAERNKLLMDTSPPPVRERRTPSTGTMRSWSGPGQPGGGERGHRQAEARPRRPRAGSGSCWAPRRTGACGPGPFWTG